MARKRPEPWVPQPPETFDERAAATLALRYAEQMQRRDFAAACRLAADPLARELHCSTRPREGGRCDGGVIHAKEDGDVVDVRLEMCFLRVARRDGQWRVVEYVPLVGYA